MKPKNDMVAAAAAQRHIKKTSTHTCAAANLNPEDPFAGHPLLLFLSLSYIYIYIYIYIRVRACVRVRVSVCDPSPAKIARDSEIFLLEQCNENILNGPVGWGCRILQLHLSRGVRSPNKCPGYDTKLSDRETPVMLELWECKVPLRCRCFLVHSDTEW